jgi:hypothetical protein
MFVCTTKTLECITKLGNTLENNQINNTSMPFLISHQSKLIQGFSSHAIAETHKLLENVKFLSYTILGLK